MTWYEEAAKTMGGDCIDIHYDYDQVLGSAEINVEKVASIIAAHDPNRWIPVEERDPRRGVIIQVFLQRGSVRRVLDAMHDGERYWFNVPCGLELTGVTHWREIVRPEVKA